MKKTSADKPTRDFGFGNVQQQKVRMLNKDGSFNVRRKNEAFGESFNIYHYLLNIPVSHFIFIIIGWFTAINILFASLYVLTGIQHLAGAEHTELGNKFLDAFFFSTQTFTTVGYGHISPIGLSSNIIASFEALVGLMSFALITGLLYGRFSKPESRLRFSTHALVAPYRDITAIMFRIANMHKNQLLDIDVQVVVSMFEWKDDKRVRSFYTLQLERNTVNFFPTSWTVVHPINNESPFFGMDEKAFRETEAELMILFKAYDDKYFQTIHTVYSYTIDEMMWGARFKPTLSVEDGWPVMDMASFHSYEKTDLHRPTPVKPSAAPSSDVGNIR